MLLKPDERMLRNLFERAGLFEEMRRARNDDQFFGTCQLGEGILVHLNDGEIFSTDNQQRRRGD